MQTASLDRELASTGAFLTRFTHGDPSCEGEGVEKTYMDKLLNGGRLEEADFRNNVETIG
jgi:hypothetical protein